MPFDIPDNDVATHLDQARWMSTDIDILAVGLSGAGVVVGCDVTAQGSPDMTVAIAAGVIRIADGSQVAVVAGNGTITTADSSNPRIDLVSASDTGTKTVTAGTAAASPKPPALPAGHVGLAMVYVPASDTTISSGQITDKRVVLPPLRAGAAWVDWAPVFKAGSTTCTWTGTAKYLDLGAIVLWKFSVSFTSTASSGTISITNLPAALQGLDTSTIMGDTFWLDQGVNFYYLMAYVSSSTEWRFYRDAAAGSQFSVAIGTSPTDSATGWGIATKSTRAFDVPSLGSGIGASLRYSSALNVTTNPQTILWNTEDSDPYGFHDLSSNTGRLTIPTGLSGWYVVECQAEYDSTGNGFRLKLRKNNTTDVAVSIAKDDDFLFAVSDVLYLAAGDYIEAVVVGVTSGQMVNTDVQSHFSIARIDAGGTTYAAQKWTSGTSFPSNPVDGERCTRTDRNIDYYWSASAAHWLSTQLYHGNFMTLTDVTVVKPLHYTTGGGIRLGWIALWQPTYDVWVEGAYFVTYVQTTNNGSNYWKFIVDFNGTPNIEQSTVADSANTRYERYVAAGYAMPAATSGVASLRTEVVGAPGDVYHAWAALNYRLIG